MSSCGGIVTTDNINVTPQARAAVQADEKRTRVTIRADKANLADIWMTKDPNGKVGVGFPLSPGEAYQFDAQGARVVVYVVGQNATGDTAHVITEGS